MVGGLFSKPITTTMKTKSTLALFALLLVTLFPSCTTIVDPTPVTTTQQATTTTTAATDPYTGTATYKKTTTTTY